MKTYQNQARLMKVYLAAKRKLIVLQVKLVAILNE